LPGPRGASTTGRRLTGAWRIARAAAHVLRGAAICAFAFPFLDRPRRMAQVRRWSAQLLRLLGIALEVHGSPRPGATLVVANHVSWLDIVAIDAVHPVRFVAKADVRRWPLLGFLVASGGTLFIERERKRDAMRVVHQVAAALAEGDVVAVFPEGTTSDGSALLPFHANLLQAAVATGTPVQPAALRFVDDEHDPSPAAPYVGDTHLLVSLWRVVTARGLRARVHWLPPRASTHADRRRLGETLRADIAAALGVEDVRDVD
jgi:1-acyl-sn-glycerol-3-phosphate acyltransferase